VGEDKTTDLKSKVIVLGDLVSYLEGSVVSREITRNAGGTVSVFAFDAGEGLSEHTAPFDAMVQVLDGSAEVTVGGAGLTVHAGETVIMPAGIPHSLHAPVRFKMLLTMIKGE